MRAGAEVIYQATFLRDGLRGHADFLFRVDRHSALGSYSYEVADTKLARRAKPYFILQLCFYSELVAGAQGRSPSASTSSSATASSNLSGSPSSPPTSAGSVIRSCTSSATVSARPIPSRSTIAGFAAGATVCDARGTPTTTSASSPTSPRRHASAC